MKRIWRKGWLRLKDSHLQFELQSKINKQINKKTIWSKNKQTNKQMNERTNKQANKRANKQTNKKTNKQMYERTNKQTRKQYGAKINRVPGFWFRMPDVLLCSTYLEQCLSSFLLSRNNYYRSSSSIIIIITQETILDFAHIIHPMIERDWSGWKRLGRIASFSFF